MPVMVPLFYGKMQSCIYSIFLLLVFIYCPHVLTSRRGRQVRESGIQVPSRVFVSCLSDRPFVIECQVCSLSTKPQVSTMLHYTVTVCCNHTAHSQTLLACQYKGSRIKSQICSGDLGIEHWTLCTSSRVYNHQTTKI